MKESEIPTSLNKSPVYPGEYEIAQREALKTAIEKPLNGIAPFIGASAIAKAVSTPEDS